MRRAAATLSAIAVSSAVMVLLGREASAAQPTTLDCLTAYEDSLKLRKNHHLRASRAKLEVCSSQSCPADVRAECSGRVPKIDASMPTIVFEARDA